MDVHALSLTAPMVYFADSQVGARLARAVNDAMNEAHTAHPERFVGLRHPADAGSDRAP